MDKNTLKLYIAEVVVNSKMSKPSKIQLLNYIQHEGDIYNLMALALDGQIVSLDEDAKQIVEGRFYLSEIPGAGIIKNIKKVRQAFKSGAAQKGFTKGYKQSMGKSMKSLEKAGKQPGIKGRYWKSARHAGLRNLVTLRKAGKEITKQPTKASKIVQTIKTAPKAYVKSPKTGIRQTRGILGKQKSGLRKAASPA